jgi:hypothetical protein
VNSSEEEKNSDMLNMKLRQQDTGKLSIHELIVVTLTLHGFGRMMKQREKLLEVGLRSLD